MQDKLQDCCLEVFSTIVNGEPLDISSIKDVPEISEELWAATIHMEADDSRLQFTAMFQEEKIKPYAQRIFKRQGEVTLSLILDMMKEFCNQTGGYLKHLLQMGTGGYMLSVPLGLKADSVPDLINLATGDFEQFWWRIEGPDFEVMCCFQSMHPEGEGSRLYQCL